MSDTFIGVKQQILKLEKEGFLMRVIDILPPSKHGTSLSVKVQNLAYIVNHRVLRVKVLSAEANFTRKGIWVCRDESFSHTGKEKFPLIPLCALERPKGVGERKKL